MNTPVNRTNHVGDCCEHSSGPAPNRQNPGASKAWSAGLFAIAAALLGSACCWLPLTLLALGLSAAGLTQFILGARWVFLAIAGLALGWSFFINYRRKKGCSEGGVCAPRGFAKFNRVMLWISAGCVLALAAFPYYGAKLFHARGKEVHAVANTALRSRDGARPTSAAGVGHHPVAGIVTNLRIYHYDIRGMDCQLCARGLQSLIAKMPGVRHVTVSYKHGSAEIQAAAGFNPETVARRISGIGYKTSLIKPRKVVTPR